MIHKIKIYVPSYLINKILVTSNLEDQEINMKYMVFHKYNLWKHGVP